MLTVTTPALLRLAKRLARSGAGREVTLRFTRREGGWKLQPGEERANDVSFAHDGRSVLVLDEPVAKAMADMTLDVEHTGAGPRLRLRRAKGRRQ